MATWAYEFKLAPREPVERGELSANSEDEARRKLRVRRRPRAGTLGRPVDLVLHACQGLCPGMSYALYGVTNSNTMPAAPATPIRPVAASMGRR